MTPIQRSENLSSQYSSFAEEQNPDTSFIERQKSALSHKIILLARAHSGFISKDNKAQLLSQGVSEATLRNIENNRSRLLGGGRNSPNNDRGEKRQFDSFTKTRESYREAERKRYLETCRKMERMTPAQEKKLYDNNKKFEAKMRAGHYDHLLDKARNRSRTNFNLSEVVEAGNDEVTIRPSDFPVSCTVDNSVLEKAKTASRNADINAVMVEAETLARNAVKQAEALGRDAARGAAIQQQAQAENESSHLSLETAEHLATDAAVHGVAHGFGHWLGGHWGGWFGGFFAGLFHTIPVNEHEKTMNDNEIPNSLREKLREKAEQVAKEIECERNDNATMATAEQQNLEDGKNSSNNDPNKPYIPKAREAFPFAGPDHKPKKGKPLKTSLDPDDPTLHPEQAAALRAERRISNKSGSFSQLPFEMQDTIRKHYQDLEDGKPLLWDDDFKKLPAEFQQELIDRHETFVTPASDTPQQLNPRLKTGVKGAQSDRRTTNESFHRQQSKNKEEGIFNIIASWWSGK